MSVLNGYVKMARFLHSKCQAKSSHTTLERVACDGNLNMFKWTKSFTPNLVEWKQRHYGLFQRIRKCVAICTDQGSLDAIVDTPIEVADFESVELVLAKAACLNRVTSIKSSFIDFL